MIQKRAFTLVSVLILLAILVVIIGVVGAVISGSMRTSSSDRDVMAARKSALTGLQIALGELQMAAGPDTRITAPASILDDSTNVYNSLSVNEEKKRWVGVWKSRVSDLKDDSGSVLSGADGNPILAEYDLTKADKRQNDNGDEAFVGWLASGTDANGGFSLPTDISDVVNPINDPAILETDENGEPYLAGGKVKIDDMPRGSRYFAFAVDDEQLKADLGWSERDPNTTDPEDRVETRMVASPGPDYSVFSNPIDVFEVKDTETIAKDVTPILKEGELIELLRTSEDLLTLSEADSEWIKTNRPHLTSGVRGLMVDVKQGGLRHDLSLAFEMDGDANLEFNSQTKSFVNPPAKFNGVSEFVGDIPNQPSDPNPRNGQTSVGGLIASYVYADSAKNHTRRSFFSDQIPDNSDGSLGETIIRGPTWWALRDYANSYKSLSGTEGDYMFRARAAFPYDGIETPLGRVLGFQEEYEPFGYATGHYSNPSRYGSTAKKWFYREMPCEQSNTPVMLGFAIVLGVLEQGGNLAMSIDPLLFLWNPYNRKMDVSRIAFTSRVGIPGDLQIWVNGVARQRKSAQAYVGVSSGRLAANRVRGEGGDQAGTWNSIAAKDLIFEPGEIKIIASQPDASAVSAGSKHPYNTDGVLGSGGILSSVSGALVTKFPSANGNNWSTVSLADNPQIEFAYGMNSSTGAGNVMALTMPNYSRNNNNLSNRQNYSRWIQSFFIKEIFNSTVDTLENFSPAKFVSDFSPGERVSLSSGSIKSGKQMIGALSVLASPASTAKVEQIAQFNPLARATISGDTRFSSWNHEVHCVCSDFSTNYESALEEVGIVLPTLNTENGFWGDSFEGDGSGIKGNTRLPMVDIPDTPLTSLAQFAHANLGVRDSDPMYAVGNSFANVFIDPEHLYGTLNDDTNKVVSDTSWLLNDALFDRYFLSALAPKYSYTGSKSIEQYGHGYGEPNVVIQDSYKVEGTIADRLTSFFDSPEYEDAKASPILEPYIPAQRTGQSIATELNPNTDPTSFRKLAAYARIKGAFNVNSTSKEAWAALLRANRDLDVYQSDGALNSDSGTGFSRGTVVPFSDDAEAAWTGLSRLDNEQIEVLASDIVNQVKLRGPFMSLSDFINRRVGIPVNTATHHMGALQAAIEESEINDDVVTEANGKELARPCLQPS